ncbi:hypothetical protein TL16_g03765 [Triparma laevis f. inornata]|uniref:Fungal lipase-type domain-containing protein n=1 Tax=Triparma laevis f. inornata TaxID=1714386 RepID=A0A9W7E0N0_9STRA|nr:hypothetical protein TL16_g03765 [Triparma laevis f. inornata]
MIRPFLLLLLLFPSPALPFLLPSPTSKPSVSNLFSLSAHSTSPYNPSLSTFLASLSFSTYVPPSTQKSYPTTGTTLKTVYLTPSFLKNVHTGILTIYFEGVNDLPNKVKTNLLESTLTGSYPDIYILTSTYSSETPNINKLKTKVNEGINTLSLNNIKRTKTIWTNTKNSTYTKPTGGILGFGETPGSVNLSTLPPIVMYVPKTDNKLILTIMDEEVSKTDECVGSVYIPLKNVKGKNEVKLMSRGKRESTNGQAVTGAVIGGMAGGPPGAVVGGVVGKLIDEGVKGEISFRTEFNEFNVDEGVKELEVVHNSALNLNWRELCDDDCLRGLEQICYLLSTTTGCTTSLYRDEISKTIVVAFRGTCEGKDLIVDGNVAQEEWVEGEKGEEGEKVHRGFRGSLESVSKRLKELINIAVSGKIESWDIKITGHSLGGALAILFCRDVAEGFDDTRGLRKVGEENVFEMLGGLVGLGKKEETKKGRFFKTVEVYTFGSPRVGNAAFCSKFDELLIDKNGKGPKINAAWRIVNNKDVVARLPRTVDGLIFGKIGYEHVGRTVLISGDDESAWIEGESEGDCPVRDGVIFSSPLTDGNVLGDVVSIVKTNANADNTAIKDKLNNVIDGVTGRVNNINSVLELASLVGIDVGYAEREAKIMESLVKGEGLADHMEPEYWRAFGGGGGYDGEDE